MVKKNTFSRRITDTELEVQSTASTSRNLFPTPTGFSPTPLASSPKPLAHYSTSPTTADANGKAKQPVSQGSHLSETKGNT